jgi:hypothetical protein
LLDVLAALAGLRTFAVTDPLLQALARGQQHALRDLPAAARAGEPALLLDARGTVGAIIEANTASMWQLARILQRT